MLAGKFGASKKSQSEEVVWDDLIDVVLGDAWRCWRRHLSFGAFLEVL
jgi:hypothetical protein